MQALRIATAALCALWLTLAAALAFDLALVGVAERAATSLRAQLDAATEVMRNPALNEQQLAQQRDALEKIRASAVEQSAKVAAPISEVKQQIASLGPAPEEGKTEAEGVAKTRADLQASLDRLQSVKSQLDVIAVEAEQQSARVSALQRDQFFQRIFDRNRSILNPSLWYDAGIGTAVLAARLRSLITVWWAEVSPTAEPQGLLLVPVFIVVFAIGYVLLGRGLARWTRNYAAGTRPPDDLSRLWRILRGLIKIVALIFVVVVPIQLALEASGYRTDRFDLVFRAVVTTISGTLVYTTFIRRLASPGLPAWRVIDVDDAAAMRFTWLAGLAAFVAMSNAQLTKLAEGLNLTLNYTIGQSALAALAMLVLLSLILVALRNQTGLAQGAGRAVYLAWFPKVAPVLWLIIIVGFLALLFGYLSLANYIALNLFRTSILLAVLFLIHHLVDAAVETSADSQSGFGRFLRRITRLGERAIERLGLLVRTIVDVVLVLAGLPMLFVLWTVTWVDFGSLINIAAMGLTIGEITLSPGAIALILTYLIAGIAATNLFIRWVDKRILAETRLDKGVQDSIRKGASYAGYIIAAGFALTAAGLDFSNLAIIAGALGVGIGFGLQSIVNNFISGLILLAERPIRVGDWVSLPVGEGLVRRINVRATEIETFDACTIIVPNSNLIIEPVKNWTHNDMMGRFLVQVTVDYASDAEEVRKLLVETAREHEKVLSAPEPVAVLARFGQFGLEFELRGFVADVFTAVFVASDIRFAILRAFHEKGITIPNAVAVMQALQK
jgi:potassium efflux system protein